MTPTPVTETAKQKVVRKKYFDIGKFSFESKEQKYSDPAPITNGVAEVLERLGGNADRLNDVLMAGLKIDAKVQAKKAIELTEGQLPTGPVKKFLAIMIPTVVAQAGGAKLSAAEKQAKAMAMIAAIPQMVESLKLYVAAEVASGADADDDNDDDDEKEA
jgi:hypothetical protein